MEKKLWSNAEVVELGLESTKNETKDFPDYWACNGCGKQYISICEPEYACIRCGSTMGYTWTRRDGDAVTQPDFSDRPIGGAPELS